MSNPVSLNVPAAVDFDGCEGFDQYDRVAYEAMAECDFDLDVDNYGDEFDDYEDEYDGQPSEYDEWQDYYGGDDWDHGQYDDC